MHGQINNRPLRIKQLDEVWEAACSVVVSLFGEDLAEERLKVSSPPPQRWFSAYSEIGQECLERF